MAYEDRQLAMAFGVMNEANTTKQAFTGTSAELELEPQKLYRLIADQDFYASMNETGTDCTSSGPPFRADVEYFVATSKTLYFFNVISAGTNGSVWVTEMLPHSNAIG